MAKSQQRQGSLGESRATLALKDLNIHMVEKIATPSRQKAGKKVYTEKVSGDRRGILENGRSVLAEVKSISEGNLQWTHLRKHQPARLTKHADYNGLSLLVWVTDAQVYVMNWTNVLAHGFGPDTGLTVDVAIELSVACEAEIRHETKTWRNRPGKLVVEGSASIFEAYRKPRDLPEEKS